MNIKAIQEWSDRIAGIAVDALIDFGSVSEKDRSGSAEVVSEEILVRLTLGDYPPEKVNK
jgi:hypothetical protein